jgi:hypothetical protein
MQIKVKPQLETEFSEDELTLRRDAVLRRMANTPPQPKASPRPKKKKKAVAGRAVRKARAGREA